MCTGSPCLNDRRRLLLAVGALFADARFARGQLQTGARRIGVLGSESAARQAGRLQQLRLGLHERGYVEGKNLVTHYRWAEGHYDRLPALANELLQLKVEVIVAVGIKAASAAREATTTVPIVLPTSVDVVGLGLAKSLARPGGNVTGFAFFGPEIIAKRLELLKEVMPGLTRAAILVNPENPSYKQAVSSMQTAARLLKIETRAYETRAPSDFAGVFRSMKANQVEAAVLHDDTVFSSNPKEIAKLGIEHRLPVAGNSELGESGALIGLGVNVPDMYRRIASLVDKLLKGAKAADLPFEQAMRFELVANQRTAKMLGLVFPPTVLVRVERIIE